MKQKTYTIIRADIDCPNRREELTRPCLTTSRKFDCSKCRYGLTKKQLITIISNGLKDTLWNDKVGLTYEQIAEKIIKRLGID